MTYVSIIIPGFKRVDQTLKTIDLLYVSEGYKEAFDFEVIVADSSPDSKLKDALEQYNKTIRYTRPDKVGIATNKNQGAKVANHPVLIFCDSDIEVKKDTLLQTLRALHKNSTIAAVGGQVIWKGGPSDGKRDRPRPEDRILNRGNVQYIEAIYSRFMATYKDVFWQVGGYDEEVFNMRGEGSDLSIRYWRAGFPLGFDQGIKAHHVFDVPDSVALRQNQPRKAIAKDLLLLVCKYNMIDGEYDNFAKTLAANFQSLGEKGYLTVFQGIAEHLGFIGEVKSQLDQQKGLVHDLFNFKFLEVFSDETLFNQCLKEAEAKVKKIRDDIFIEDSV